MAVAHVSRVDGSSDSAVVSSISASAAAHVTGNMLAVFVSSRLANVTVSDTAGNTYYLAAEQVVSSPDIFSVWYAYNITGHVSNVVTATATSGSSDYFTIAVREFSGFGANNPFSGVCSGVGTTETSLVTPTVPISNADAMVFEGMVASGQGIAGAGSFTVNVNSGSLYFGDGYRLVSTGTAGAAACTSGSRWGLLAVSFSVRNANLVQISHASASSGASSVSSIATPARAHVTGNMVAAYVFCRSTQWPLTSVTDTAGNTYNQAGTHDFGGGYALGIWYAFNITGNASNVVTALAPSGGDYMSIGIVEMQGFGTSDPFVDFDYDSGSGVTVASPSLSVTSENSWIFAGMECDGGSAQSLECVVFGHDGFFGYGYRFVSADAIAKASCGSGAWRVVAASFSLASGGGDNARNSDQHHLLMA